MIYLDLRRQIKTSVVTTMEVAGNIDVSIVPVPTAVYAHEGFERRMDGVEVLLKIIHLRL